MSDIIILLQGPLRRAESGVLRPRAQWSAQVGGLRPSTTYQPSPPLPPPPSASARSVLCSSPDEARRGAPDCVHMMAICEEPTSSTHPAPCARQGPARACRGGNKGLPVTLQFVTRHRAAGRAAGRAAPCPVFIEYIQCVILCLVSKGKVADSKLDFAVAKVKQHADAYMTHARHADCSHDIIDSSTRPLQG